MNLTTAPRRSSTARLLVALKQTAVLPCAELGGDPLTGMNDCPAAQTESQQAQRAILIAVDTCMASIEEHREHEDLAEYEDLERYEDLEECDDLEEHKDLEESDDLKEQKDVEEREGLEEHKDGERQAGKVSSSSVQTLVSRY